MATENKHFRAPLAENSKDVSRSRTTTKIPEETDERRKLLMELSAHKSQLIELKCCREEVGREMTIETALMSVELDEVIDESHQFAQTAEKIQQDLAACQQKIYECIIQMQEHRANADVKLAEHRQMLHKLRSRLECIEVNLDDDSNEDDKLRIEIFIAVDKMAELLKTEQKMFADVELGLLENEAKLLKRREELTRNENEVEFKYRDKQTQVRTLQEQIDSMRCNILDQLQLLDADINALESSIQQGYATLESMKTESLSMSPLKITKESFNKNLPTGRKDNGFQPDESPCRGFLRKKSGKKSGCCRWSKRWFVFDRQSGTLSYYRRKFDEEGEGDEMCKSTSFQDIQEVYVDNTHGKKRLQGRVFVVKTARRTLRLSAMTEQAVAVWVDALSTAALKSSKTIEENESGLEQ